MNEYPSQNVFHLKVKSVLIDTLTLSHSLFFHSNLIPLHSLRPPLHSPLSSSAAAPPLHSPLSNQRRLPAVAAIPSTLFHSHSPRDDGVPLPIDASKPNPNGMEFDNLYLDMNGIIHPCFHPGRYYNGYPFDRFARQGVAKLPFIEEKKLLAATRKLEETLTEEEQLRNSVMLDLLYVNRAHNLASHILLYYKVFGQLPMHERSVFPIDTNASGGMNGYLWLCERNIFNSFVSSPIDGLQDIECNKVLNITYLNPSRHGHIPKPPDGVVIPKKILKATDIKPLPVLWHEDNVGRGQQARERPLAPGAIAGSQLGEAAHRLVKNSLNIKLNNNGSWEQPPVHRTMNRLQSAGSSGYGNYYGENRNGYHVEYNHHVTMTRPTYPFSSNGGQIDRQNFRMQDRSWRQEQFQNVNTGFSALTIEEGVRPRPSRLPNYGITTNLEPRFVQHMGPPITPQKWNSKAPPRNEMYMRRQEAAVGAVSHDKRTKKVYQVKTRLPHDTPEYGNQ